METVTLPTKAYGKLAGRLVSSVGRVFTCTAIRLPKAGETYLRPTGIKNVREVVKANVDYTKHGYPILNIRY